MQTGAIKWNNFVKKNIKELQKIARYKNRQILPFVRLKVSAKLRNFKKYKNYYQSIIIGYYLIDRFSERVYPNAIKERY